MHEIEVIKCERGETRPSYKTSAKLSKTLGVSERDLLYPKNETEKNRTVKMFLKNEYTIVRTTRAGRNTNAKKLSVFIYNTSIEVGSALMYLYVGTVFIQSSYIRKPYHEQSSSIGTC